MLSTDDRHNIGAAVHNDSKHLQKISAQDAHVQCFVVRACRVVPAKHDFLAIVSRQPDLRGDRNRIDKSPYASDAISGIRRFKVQRLQHIRAHHGSIRTRVNQKLNGPPFMVSCQNVGANHRSHDAIVAFEPLAVKSHKSWPLCPWGCTV